MKTLLRAAVTAAALFIAAGAMAAPRMATLEVQNVSCASCGPIVMAVLKNVVGVSDVDVVEDAGIATATVNFDDEIVSAEALAEAVSNYGFPTTVMTAGKDKSGSMSIAPTTAEAGTKASRISRWLGLSQ
jgi:mercuric ion binding protein